MKTLASVFLFRAFLVIIVLPTSCATVPLTGRKQLSLVNESEVMSLSLSQ
jgi:hypothetical protein